MTGTPLAVLCPLEEGVRRTLVISVGDWLVGWLVGWLVDRSSYVDARSLRDLAPLCCLGAPRPPLCKLCILRSLCFSFQIFTVEGKKLKRITQRFEHSHSVRHFYKNSPLFHPGQKCKNVTLPRSVQIPAHPAFARSKICKIKL